jgi:hypothetical protein
MIEKLNSINLKQNSRSISPIPLYIKEIFMVLVLTITRDSESISYRLGYMRQR